jgi:hypothetical protein
MEFLDLLNGGFLGLACLPPQLLCCSRPVLAFGLNGVVEFFVFELLHVIRVGTIIVEFKILKIKLGYR